MNSAVRMAESSDIPFLKEVLNDIELFPAEYLDDMILDYLDNPESEDLWFVKTDKGKPVGFGYCAPEKFTEGTFNLLAIGVAKEQQGSGGGMELMAFVEALLRREGHRILIVETSGGSAYAKTRRFYEKLGYAKEAVIRDFWAEGEDKVVFWKKLV